MPISVLVWVRSFTEPAVLTTIYRSTIPFRFMLHIVFDLMHFLFSSPLATSFSLIAVY